MGVLFYSLGGHSVKYSGSRGLSPGRPSFCEDLASVPPFSVWVKYVSKFNETRTGCQLIDGCLALLSLLSLFIVYGGGIN